MATLSFLREIHAILDAGLHAIVARNARRQRDSRSLRCCEYGTLARLRHSHGAVQGPCIGSHGLGKVQPSPPFADQHGKIIFAIRGVCVAVVAVADVLLDYTVDGARRLLVVLLLSLHTAILVGLHVSPAGL